MDATAASKRTNGASSACPLPEEIVEDILSCLPAKSLRRFQCVSRSLRALITSRAFQDAHFRRNRGNHRRLFIRPAGCLESFYSWQPGGRTVEKIMSARRLPQGTTFPVSNKSCHGLVLLSNLHYYTHLVWNPSTGEILTLPDRRPLRVSMQLCSRGPLVSYGLGYCSATRRHKAVRMYYADENLGPNAYTICEVFTLNESAYWTPVAAKPPVFSPREKCRQISVFCNGNIHFLQDEGSIIVFNVTDETFGMLKLPRELQDCYSNNNNLELAELGGYLCAFIVIKKERNLDSGYPFVLWLLRDYYDGNWEKLSCSFDWGTMPEAAITSSWIAPLDIYYYDGCNVVKKIMFGTGSCNVFTVDPNTGALEILFSPEDTVIGECRDSQFPVIGLFEESLAGLRETNTMLLRSPWMQAWSEVLSRLPARTVQSLGQVCRGWRAMIKSELFVAAHGCRANLNKSPQMMFVNGFPYGFEPVDHFINPPKVAPLIGAESRIVCSKPVHGLNAGSFANYDFVCNPLTGYYKALPLEHNRDWKFTMYDLLETVTSCDGFINGDDDTMFTGGRLGLGYDQESSRHVLVRLAYKERNSKTRGYQMVCKVRYVQDMIWDVVQPPPRPIANMPPAYVNGKLYWMVDTELGPRSSAGHEIVALDVRTRGFEVLQGPPCDRENSEHMSIVELEEMVCITCSHQRMGIIKLWAMNEHIPGVWSVKYDIELDRFSPEYLPETTALLAVDPKDGRILLSTGRALGYYDPRTAELETIYRLGKYTERMKFVPVLYEESLVAPPDPIL